MFHAEPHIHEQGSVCPSGQERPVDPECVTQSITATFDSAFCVRSRGNGRLSEPSAVC